MCGWRGGRSARYYMCRNERMHFLNMIGHPVPEHLLPNKSSRRSRAEDEREGKVEGDRTREGSENAEKAISENEPGELKKEENGDAANDVEEESVKTPGAANDLANGRCPV